MFHLQFYRTQMLYWCCYLATGTCLSFPWGLIYSEVLSISGCTACAAFGTSAKLGLGWFVAGAATGASELTLSQESETGCVTRVVPEPARLLGSQTCCDKSCPVLVEVIFLYHCGSFFHWFGIYLLLLYYLIIFLDSFIPVTAATWCVIKSNGSKNSECLSVLLFETKFMRFALPLVAQTWALLADRWISRW